MPAVREGYGHMKQTETDSLEIPKQTSKGDETRYCSRFYFTTNSETKQSKLASLGATSYPVCFIWEFPHPIKLCKPGTSKMTVSLCGFKNKNPYPPQQ